MLVLLLVSGTIVSLSMGMRQSMGLFMGPLTTDLGISAATFSFSLALQNIVWGLSQPVVGALADRYGARPALVVTALIYAAGLGLMVVSQGATGLNIGGFLCGIGVAGTAFGVLIGVVARATPPEKRIQRVGLIAAVGSIGTMVLAPTAQSILARFGWQAALATFTGIALVIAVLSLFIKETKAADARPASEPLRKALVDAA